MKKTFILITLIFSIQAMANELAWVDEQIEAIKPPREGINQKKLSALNTPFIFLKKNMTKKEEKDKKTPTKSSSNGLLTSKTATTATDTAIVSKQLILLAVINNSALINDKWYKKGAKIDQYTLSQINRNHVILKKGKKTLLLSTRSKNSKLKFKEK